MRGPAAAVLPDAQPEAVAEHGEGNDRKAIERDDQQRGKLPEDFSCRDERVTHAGELPGDLPGPHHVTIFLGSYGGHHLTTPRSSAIAFAAL